MRDIIKTVFSSVAAVSAVAMATSVALANDYTTGKSNVDFFYLELEGGFAGFSGPEDTAPGNLLLEPDSGGYVTGTLGHISIDKGIIGGYVDRAELWLHYEDHGDDSATGAGPITYSSDRSYFEVGTRFQHYYDQHAMNKMMWGFEPFIGFVDGDFSSTMGTSIPYDATIYGAMVSFESETYLNDRTMLNLRAAAGAYGGSSDSGNAAFADDDFAGFRGQLAAGINYKVSDTVKVGAVARMDYFSDMPVVNVPGGTMDTDDQFGGYVGVNLNVIFAGVYQ